MSFVCLILLLVLINPPARADASSEIDERRDEAKEPWKPPFVGGVNGPILGVGYNGFLQIDGASYANDASGEFEDDVIVRRARFTFHRNKLTGAIGVFGGGSPRTTYKLPGPR